MSARREVEERIAADVLTQLDGYGFEHVRPGRLVRHANPWILELCFFALGRHGHYRPVEVVLTASNRALQAFVRQREGPWSPTARGNFLSINLLTFNVGLTSRLAVAPDLLSGLEAEARQSMEQVGLRGDQLERELEGWRTRNLSEARDVPGLIAAKVREIGLPVLELLESPGDLAGRLAEEDLEWLSFRGAIDYLAYTVGAEAARDYVRSFARRHPDWSIPPLPSFLHEAPDGTPTDPTLLPDPTLR